MQQGEVAIGHDFTEALCIVVHNEEIQSKHFGGGVRVSIEGYTVHYPSFMDGSSLVFDFHSYLSDDTTQMACTVHCHMIKLITQLMNDNVLSKGGRLLSTTDGCAKQYKCATAIYLLSMLSKTYNIVIDRALCAPGHGKSEVDSINGVDKNTIHRKSMRKVVHAADMSDPTSNSSTSLKAHTFTNISNQKRYSPAEDCKRVLEAEGSEGVKSVVKREKREKERGINKRYWHVREVDDDLVGIKCATITHPKFETGVCTFQDMYHYYTCPDMEIGMAALRRQPCNCAACDETIRKPWDPDKEPEQQPRFENPEDFFGDLFMVSTTMIGTLSKSMLLEKMMKQWKQI